MSNMVKKEICQAVKKDGELCKNKAKIGTRYCGVHKNYYLFSDADVKVYYPCGKSVIVKYNKDIQKFKELLDEYKTHIIKIYIKGEEDEVTELPQHIESVYCLLENPRYLKVGFVAYNERDEWTKIKRYIINIYHANDYRDRVVFQSYIINENGDMINNLGKASLSINKIHTKFINTNNLLAPQDFNESESESE